MGNLIRRVLAPIISFFLLMFGSGFLQTFISARLHLDGQSASLIGFVQGAFYLGYLVAVLKIEHLIGRIRHIRAFSFFVSIATVIILLQGLVLSPYAWILIRIINGVCIASLYVVVESWLLIAAPDSHRGAVLAIYMITLYCSQTLSQFVISFVDIEKGSAFLITGILFAAAIIPVTFTRTQVPDIEEPSMGKVARFFKASPLGCFGCFVGGLILGALYTFSPIFAQVARLPIPAIMSTTIAGGFLLQWPIGRLSDVFNRRTVLFLLSVATVLVCFGIIIFGKSEIALYILLFLLGGVTFTIYPVSITQVCDRFQPKDITVVTRVLVGVFGAGAVIGPIIAPVFINDLSIYGLYIYVLCVSFILALVGVYTFIRRKPVPKDKQEHFVPIPPQTPVSTEMDPRSDEHN